MTSVQIQTVLQGPDTNESVNRAIRVINASFPSLRQVNSGTTLTDAINEARATSESCTLQLVASQEHVDKLIRDTRSKAKEQLVVAQELSLLRHSLSDELTSLTEDLESSMAADGSEPSLLEEIETLHRNLKELQSVKGYVQVIHRALQFSEEAIKCIDQIPAAAHISEATLANYVLLQQLVLSIQQACNESEIRTGQEIKIVSFLADLRDKTWLRMKDVLSTTLLSAAEGLHWPMPVDYAAANVEIRKVFEGAFANLLRIQEIGEKLNSGQDTSISSNDGMYPLQVLVKPVVQRFKYHFEGTRQTNRLDKPEWYFAHILNVSHEHRTFLEKVLQRLLQASKYSLIDAWREFTRLLLPIIGRKIRRSMPTLLPHPPLLAHTIYQSLAFDEALREAGFSLAGTLKRSKDDLSEWEGTSVIILENKEWFDAWLEGERKFAEDQYNDIIMSPNAWQLSNILDEDATNDSEVRPTNSARRVKALFEQITDRYRALPRLLHRFRFFIDIQARILELYHARISETLDEFETRSGFLTRTVPGALVSQPGHARDRKSIKADVDDAQSLVQAYVSAKWITHVMSAWGEDMFFLELWHKICEEDSLRSRVKAVGTLPDPDGTNDEGTIFDKLITQYNLLAERTEDMLVKQITGEVEAHLKEHLFKQSDATEESEGVLISQTLLGPLARLSAHLISLTKTLPGPAAISLYRRIADHVAFHILQRQVLYRGRSRMSSRVGHVVLEETNLWVEASRTAMSPSGLRRVEGPWVRLLEAGRLLSLEREDLQRMANPAQLEDDKTYEQFAEGFGITDLGKDDVRRVLNVREDLPR